MSRRPDLPPAIAEMMLSSIALGLPFAPGSLTVELFRRFFQRRKPFDESIAEVSGALELAASLTEDLRSEIESRSNQLNELMKDYER
jgi:hypothetical protein